MLLISVDISARPRRNNFVVYSSIDSDLFESLDSDKGEANGNSNNIPKYYVLKQINQTDFVLIPAHFNGLQLKVS